MAKITADDVHFVRIGGVTNGSGTVYTFTTRTPPATWSGTSVNALDTPITVKAAPMKFLGSLSSAPSISITLRQAGSQTAPILQKQSRSSLVRSAATNAAVRLTSFVRKSSSALSVTDSAPFLVGAYYWIGAQAFKVTGKPDSTTLSVNRDQLGTYRAAIPIPSVGPTFNTLPPSTKGLPVTAGVIDSAGNEEIRFRGFVDSVGIASGLRISIGVRSAIQQIRDAIYSPPVARNAPVPASAGADPRRDGYMMIRDWEDLEVDADMYGPSVSDAGDGAKWDRVRWVGSGGEWLVTSVEYLSTTTEDGRKIDRYTPPVWTGSATVPIAVHSFGKNATVYELQSAMAQQEHIRAVFDDLDRAEWCYAYADGPEWAPLVQDLLVRDEPYGSGMGIHTDYLSTDFEGTANARLPQAGIGVPVVLRNTRRRFDDWTMPAMESKKWSDLFRDGFFRPIFRGLATDSAGRLRAMNWLEDPGSSFGDVKEITEAHAIGSGSYKIEDKQIDAIGLYVLNFGFETRKITETGERRASRRTKVEDIGEYQANVFNPDSSHAELAQVDEVEIPGTIGADDLWADVITDLARTALYMFGTAVEILTLDIQPNVTVTPGDRVTITRRDFPKANGTFDTSSTVTLEGFALGAGIDRGRIQSLRIAVTGRSTDPAPTLGTWAPVATVTGWDAGSKYATISANNWTSTTHPIGITADYKAWDLLDWAGGETAAVIICDADFSTLGTGTLTNVHSTLGLKLTGTTATPAAGNLIIPAAYDSQTAAFKAATWQDGKGGPVVFLSGSNGELGAAGADGFGWLA